MRTFAASLAIAAALVQDSLAACGDTNYNRLASYVEPNQCQPDGYFQAEDLGQTTTDQLISRCEARCTAFGVRCTSFVGTLQTAPNGLSTGQCFYYPSAPPPARYCVDHPTTIVAEVKDGLSACFTSSSAVASAYCSSLLSLGTTTITLTTTSGTVTTTVSQTSFATTTEYSCQERRARDLSGLDRLEKRVRATSPAPACASASAPARVSSACSCFVSSKTITSRATVPQTTQTVTSATTSTSTTYFYPPNSIKFNIKVGTGGGDSAYVRLIQSQDPSYAYTSGLESTTPPTFYSTGNNIFFFNKGAQTDSSGRLAFGTTPSSYSCTYQNTGARQITCSLAGQPLAFYLDGAAPGNSDKSQQVIKLGTLPAGKTAVNLYVVNLNNCNL